MKVIVPYSPRPLQAALHNALKRFNVLVMHRRFGKTVFCINEIIKKASVNTKTRPQYAYIAPTQKQAKIIAWDYLKHYTAGIPGVKYNETELRCDLPNKARIYLLGAENPDNLRGLYLDGAVLDEVAQQPASIWREVIRPALADRNGWAIFIGTPKGQNFFYELYEKANKIEGWTRKLYKASVTKILPQSELDAIRAEIGDDAYEQELECSFTAAIKGTYYGKLMTDLETSNHIKTIAHDPSLPVVTSWDLGINGKTAIWFVQSVIGENRVIDYYENTGEGLPHYIDMLKAKPYIYDYHILPHDIKVRSLSTGKTRLDLFIQFNLKYKIAPKLPVQEGITAVRTLLPTCFFDKDKCHAGMIALSNYRSDYNEKLGRYGTNPRQDDFAHAADSFRYLALTLRPAESDEKIKFRQTYLKTRRRDDYDPLDCYDN